MARNMNAGVWNMSEALLLASLFGNPGIDYCCLKKKTVFARFADSVEESEDFSSRYW